jgi:CBS domain-containing protein
MTVADIARTDVMTAKRDQSAGNLATVMKEEDVGSVIIVDDGRPVGIVTDRDLVVEVLEPRQDPTRITAGDIMTESPVTLQQSDGVYDATSTMFEHAVRRIPVVDDDGSVAGILTLDDVVILLADELDDIAGVIEAESPPY